MAQHKFSTSWTNGSTPLTAQEIINAGAEANLDIAVATGVTNQATPLSLVRSKLQSVFLLSNFNVTILTNSTSSPQDTVNLIAGVPVEWTVNAPLSRCPFGGDVATFYISNSSGSNATVSVRAAYNP